MCWTYYSTTQPAFAEIRSWRGKLRDQSPVMKSISDKQALVLMVWQRSWVGISLVFTHGSRQSCIHEAGTLWLLFDTL